MINFIQVDAVKMQLLAQTLPYVMRLPMLIVVCIIVLFIYLGLSFFAGLGVFAITFLTNTVLGKLSAKL